jgi:hypothetical protein
VKSSAAVIWGCIPRLSKAARSLGFKGSLMTIRIRRMTGYGTTKPAARKRGSFVILKNQTGKC